MPGRIRNTNIFVDYFRSSGPILPGGKPIYFLTHNHMDHVAGLTDGWNGGQIYCSLFCKKMLHRQFDLDDHQVIALLLNEPTMLTGPDTVGTGDSFCVTLIDANHCPGAVMFFFQGRFGNILHTGDCRANEDLVDRVLKLSPRIDVMYLDNTFCDPVFDFPSQEIATSQITDFMSSYKFGREGKRANYHHNYKEEQEQDYILSKDRNAVPNAIILPRYSLDTTTDARVCKSEASSAVASHVRFVVAIPSIGKESLLENIARHFRTKILVSEKRFSTMLLAECDATCFTTRHRSVGKSTPWIRAVARNKLTLQYISILNQQSHCNLTLGINPTGFACLHGNKNRTSDQRLFMFPYSLHSSYSELRNFVRRIQPGRVIATSARDLPSLHRLRVMVKPFLDRSKCPPGHSHGPLEGKLSLQYRQQPQANIHGATSYTTKVDDMHDQAVNCVSYTAQTIIDESQGIYDQTEENLLNIPVRKRPTSHPAKTNAPVRRSTSCTGIYARKRKRTIRRSVSMFGRMPEEMTHESINEQHATVETQKLHPSPCKLPCVSLHSPHVRDTDKKSEEIKQLKSHELVSSLTHKSIDKSHTTIQGVVKKESDIRQTSTSPKSLTDTAIEYRIVTANSPRSPEKTASDATKRDGAGSTKHTVQISKKMSSATCNFSHALLYALKLKNILKEVEATP